ncbi:SDR family oxidoreductase [Polynucleobacter sp. JS-Polo-80-F4]|uniref:SDR family oxidoreductase n=1 Tax=Polynucleobacter sp. JS-Polo-80-F4 TaxID=2576918 RepID=UPI001C0DD70D|nr:SDR family oxidoreductase [Polynucleobacter sp. JS-Polo-80-F4]MBU3616737.1 SDR family oxidoreductase [Polynucleobacter sp. JS-Polo-80-F4]
MFKDFSEIQVGDSESISKTITESDVRRFVEMTGDDNPLHVDAAYAESTAFKDIVVHGMLGASYISTVIGTRLPGTGALWVSQNFDFLLPVRLGDELSISCTVLKKFERERLLELETKIVNQHQQTVLTGTGKVKVLSPSLPKEIAEEKSALRVAVVTGGSGGIGKAISLRLANDGFAVVIAYRGRVDRANTVVKEIYSNNGKAIAVCADISTKEGVELLYKSAVKEFGGVSVLVNNASSAINPKSFELMDWEDVQNQLNTQLKGSFLLCQSCIPKMIERGWGRIVNITSQVVEGEPTSGWTSYAIAKASLAKFSSYLAAHLGSNGITVNCVSPGMSETGLIGSISEKVQLMIARQTPTRRLTKPEDVAAAVAYLVSSDASQVTGQTILVNGGIVTS